MSLCLCLFVFCLSLLTVSAVVCPLAQYGTISTSRRSGPPVTRLTKGEGSADAIERAALLAAPMRSLRYAEEEKENLISLPLLSCLYAHLPRLPL